MTDAEQTQALPRTPSSWKPPEPEGLRSDGASPRGQSWFVTRIPCPRVVLNSDHVTVDGQRLELTEGQLPSEAATERLQQIATALRGADGAVRAAISTGLTGEVRNVIVTARGGVFDDTESFAAPGLAVASAFTRPRKPSRKILAAAGAGVAAVVVAVVVIVAVSGGDSPAAPAVAATYQAAPTPFPLVPPVGFAQQAAWSAPIDGQSVPLVTSTGKVVTIRDRSVVALEASTGAPVWSSSVPEGAAGVLVEPGGLHLSLIDGAESVVAITPKSLVWWPVSGSAHELHQVDLPASAAVSFAGSTPLITVPEQHAQIVAKGALRDYVVPAGAVALAAQDDTVIAASSAGQVWASTAATATSPPNPWTLAPPAGATALDTVAGFTVPFAADGPARHGVLVLVWYTADPATRIVSLADTASQAGITPTVTVPASAVAGAAFSVSPHGGLGLFGPVLVDADKARLLVLDGWASRTVADYAAYGVVGGAPKGVSPAGDVFSTGSASTPLGVSGDIAIVATTSAAGTSTLYGLPRTAPGAAAQTASVPPLRAPGPTPAQAPSPLPPPPALPVVPPAPLALPPVVPPAPPALPPAAPVLPVVPAP